VTVDPVAREVVRDGEHELVVVDRERLDLAEPRPVRRVVERPSKPTRDVVPDPFRSQLDWVLHSGLLAPRRREKKREHSSGTADAQRPLRGASEHG
jgi:hypothetical protein